MAAQWSGVSSSSSTHNGLQRCLSMKYLTMCRWPKKKQHGEEEFCHADLRCLGHTFDQRWSIGVCSNAHILLLDVEQCHWDHLYLFDHSASQEWGTSLLLCGHYALWRGSILFGISTHWITVFFNNAKPHSVNMALQGSKAKWSVPVFIQTRWIAALLIN